MKKLLLFLFINGSIATFTGQSQACTCSAISTGELLQTRMHTSNSLSQEDLRNQLGHCESVAQQIQQAQDYSARLFAGGKLASAIRYLQSHLERLAHETAISSRAPFHTITALHASYRITSEYLDYSGEIDTLPLNQLMALYDLHFSAAEIVIWAYEHLDRTYFPTYIKHCYRGHYCYREGVPLYRFPREYFEGIGELGLKYLRLLAESAPKASYVTMELKLTEIMTEATAQVLDQSVYRRDFSCQINSLNSIAQYARNYICHPDDLDPVSAIDFVRRQVGHVYTEIERSIPGRKYCHL